MNAPKLKYHPLHSLSLSFSAYHFLFLLILKWHNNIVKAYTTCFGNIELNYGDANQ